MERNYVVMDIDRYESQICRFYEHIKDIEENRNRYSEWYHKLREEAMRTIDYIDSERKGDEHIIVVDTNKFLAALEAAADYRPMRDRPMCETFDEPEAVTEENEASNE